MNNDTKSTPSFWKRLGTGMACFWRAMMQPDFARQAAALLRASTVPSQPATKAIPPERLHASGLWMLSLLQREGRLIDFLQEDLTAFSDAEIGSAARVVHAGCRKVLQECLALEPVLKEPEGGLVSVPAGFDAQRIRLTGNVTGQPPFRGTLKHHGWVTATIRLPAMADSLDPRILASAEVELT